jgi:hypothetical protein
MISLLNKLVDWFIAVNWYNILVVIIGPISVLIGIGSLRLNSVPLLLHKISDTRNVLTLIL